MFRSFVLVLLLSALLTGCAAIGTMASGASPETPSAAAVESSPASDCPVTEPVWAKPPEDSAVQNPPAYGYYFVNEDRSIWSSAGRSESEDSLRAGEEGNKVGWFRPEGAALVITGERIDGQAPPLEAHVPCCYPTRFQATGLSFPTEGCWRVTAKAADRVLSFVVAVEP
jgi:hypothetical protein